MLLLLLLLLFHAAVVVTTYSTLGTECFGKRGRFSDVGSPLAHIKWVSARLALC